MQRMILFFLMLSVLLGGCAAPGAVSKGIPTDISVIDTDYKLSWLITREDFVLDDAGEKQYTGGSQRIVLTLEDGQRVTCMGDSHDGQSIAVGQHVSVWWEQSGAAVVPEEAQA